MTGPQKRKGDRAEREAADLLTALLGRNVRRLLGAGRSDDIGDLDVKDWAIQVCDWADLSRAVRVKPLDAAEQALNSGTRHSAAMVRLRGGDFRFVMTPGQWTEIVTEIETLRADVAMMRRTEILNEHGRKA